MILTKLGHRQAETIELLQEHEECSANELEELGDGGANSYRHATRCLRERGIVESRQNPLNPKEKLHTLTEEYR